MNMLKCSKIYSKCRPNVLFFNFDKCETADQRSNENCTDKVLQFCESTLEVHNGCANEVGRSTLDGCLQTVEETTNRDKMQLQTMFPQSPYQVRTMLTQQLTIRGLIRSNSVF